MPQMGESIAEGTIVRWIKKVGDSVDRDEPLFEISTDKVDAEIPSPAAGVLTAIAVKEGETVPVNSVVATIGAAGEAPPEPPAEAVAAVASATSGAEHRPKRRRPTAHPAPPSTRRPRHRRPTRAPAASGTGCARAPGRARRSRPARRRAPQVITAGPQDRQGTQRRHRPHPGIRHRRPRHQAGHPRVYREGTRVRRPALRSFHERTAGSGRASLRSARRPATKSSQCR